MQQLNKQVLQKEQGMEELPERIIQFGEGNFLRGFVDWMVHELNKQDLFNGRIVAIQPTPHGKVVPVLNAQDGLYTLALRGVEKESVINKLEIISSISRGINPYEDWNEVINLAENPQIQFVFSNTTEAGLTYVKEKLIPGRSSLSFPGKLTAFLYHRYQVLGDSKASAMIIVPCELLEDNGSLLEKTVLQIAKDWGLPDAFSGWIQEHNQFCNTLVDRIVTGYPKDQIEDFRNCLGYEDALLTVGEPYHLFAIEADEEVAELLPFHRAGLNVHWAQVKPFRESKVRILNGAHTLMVPVAFLAGKNTVLETMEDESLRQFVLKGIYQEILPCLSVDEEQKKRFADSVIDRFLNPFSHHFLSDIAVHSFAKCKVRLLPTLLDTVQQRNRLPEAVTFSFAALLLLYRGRRITDNQLAGYRGEEEYIIRDEPEVLVFVEEAWSFYKEDTGEQVEKVVEMIGGREALWGTNLNQVPCLVESISNNVNRILQLGMRQALDELLQGEDYLYSNSE
ncbi:tagaturonate reductase [Aneurinibacillus tyrosinisolvens]|uniref:tagaturonate reductase n=1 Tax=Aneurinibacillus tyrosinisolvens TaxID=1443435 RepID=UPI00063F3F87|nr:tagaturonate reductase [Aneurinibacillus tyrosinisolvens]